MKLEPLSLLHKAILKEPLGASGLFLSEYSFGCLYLFRKAHKYEVCLEGPLCIKGMTYDGFSFYMPTSLKSFQELLANDAFTHIYPIPEEWLIHVDEAKWAISFNDADSDYLYETQQLAHYSGRHLAKKRNLVHQFEERYKAEAFSLTKERMEDALTILKIWQNAPNEEADIAATKEALELVEELTLEGKIYYVESKPVGFLLGEGIGGKAFVVHFAKADIAYKGVYQYLYQSFSQTLEKRYSIINMEQDLGREELRHAKHSYHPIQLAKKYRLIRKA